VAVQFYKSLFHATEENVEVADKLTEKADLAIQIRDLSATLSREEICKKFSITESQFENLIRGIL
jgi:predicted XRE-type DNA-binding protein